METEKKQGIPPYIMLFIVAIVMSFAISGIYNITKDKIASAAAEAEEAARRAVMTQAVSMAEVSAEGTGLDSIFAAYDGAGGAIGYVGQITVIGFGGEIQVTVGMDMTGTITGVSVGGANFSETSGLGAKTRDEAFTSQFAGKSGMLVLKQDIDSVTGASVSSGAVVSGVNKALTCMSGLLPQNAVSAVAEELPLTAEQTETLLPGATSVSWMGGGTGIDGWWEADNGYIVRATGFGEGPIVVTMGFDNAGYVQGIIIGDENFMESEGLGAKVLEPAFWQQFLGKTGGQTFGQGVDAVSGATVSSEATLGAINACMTFDPAGAENAAVQTVVSGEIPVEISATPAPTVIPDRFPPVPTPDAETAATTEATPAPTPVPTPDAETAATAEEEPVPTPTPMPSPTPAPDAETAATAEATPVPTPSPTPAPTPAPDAETSASVTE